MTRIERYTRWLLNLEKRNTRRASSRLRSQLVELMRAATALYVALVGDLQRPVPLEVQPLLRAGLVRGLARLRIDDPAHLYTAAHRGLQLGVRQGQLVLGIDPGPIPFSPQLDLAIREGNARARAQLQEATNRTRLLPLHNYPGVVTAVASGHRAATSLERTAAWVTNRAANEGMWALANAARAGRVWVAERDACLHCLAYAGHVVGYGEPFPGGLTFYRDPNGILRPLDWETVDAPPLHPHCRCQAQPWLGSRPGVGPVELPEALRREALRAVARGDAVASNPARLRAAAALLGSEDAPVLPQSVLQRAARAVAAGQFPDRSA